MVRLPVRRFGLLSVALAIGAIVHACADDPADPVIDQVTLTVLVECDETTYLAQLSPVLAVWEDSIETWQGGADFLDTPPAWTGGSTAEGHLAVLVPVLQQWEVAINARLGTAVLDPLADFEPTTPRRAYLASMSSLLVSWEGALETLRGSDFLPAVPRFQPLVIADVTAEPSVLWPPNHKWVDVEVVLESQAECAPDSDVTCTIVEVTSDEPENGVGDGNTAPDWLITGDRTLMLRAERSGSGDGRVYTIRVRCEDDSGNVAERTVEVVVPHDQDHAAR